MAITLLGIESSCDDTSAAVVRDGFLLSNVIAGQEVHKAYGGVVPELASRAHQANIIPVVNEALRQAGITVNEIDGIAFTRGPGLLGSLLVGTSFAKGLSIAINKPLIDVNHLQGHIFSHYLLIPGKENKVPAFPHLCMLVSGGHTQIIKVLSHSELQVIGQTIDDAAGEAFDKCAKVLELPYPGGPEIDRLAKTGDPAAFRFAKPRIPGLDFSFSGLKTSFLYFLRDQLKADPEFKHARINDLCASYQRTIVDILAEKMQKAVQETGIKTVTLSGGVSANSELRERFAELGTQKGWDVFIPERRFTTDNAAMIAITGYVRFQANLFASHDITPLARFEIS